MYHPQEIYEVMERRVWYLHEITAMTLASVMITDVLRQMHKETGDKTESITEEDVEELKQTFEEKIIKLTDRFLRPTWDFLKGTV